MVVEEELTPKGMIKFGVVVIVIQLYAFIKEHSIIHLTG